MKIILSLLICVFCGLVTANSQIEAIHRADCLPASTPWDLRSLSEPPLAHDTSDPLSDAANARAWTTQAATLEQDTITSEPPPTPTTAWFLTVEDDQGALVSSPLHFHERN